MTRKMRLYVWDHVLCDCSCGIAVAVARTESEAREILLKIATDDWERKALAADISGAPAEILDAPAGAFCWGGA